MNIYDRVCELCQIANKIEADKCFELTTFKHELNTAIVRCPYRQYVLSRHEEDYAICNKTGNHCHYVEVGD